MSGEEEEAQQLIEIPESEATEKINAFIRDNPGSRTSEIICELGLDPSLTLRVLAKLQKENKIKGKTIERK